MDVVETELRRIFDEAATAAINVVNAHLNDSCDCGQPHNAVVSSWAVVWDIVDLELENSNPEPEVLFSSNSVSAALGLFNAAVLRVQQILQR